jgi:nuclear pore complex protein Nup85
MLITVEEAYELLRHLEEVHIHAEQGSGADYLGALELIMRGGDQDSGKAQDTNNALRQLQVVRLALARYLARCSVGGL